MKKVILLILAFLITLIGGYMYLQNGDKAIGAIVWIGEDHEEAPAVESFTLEYMETKDDGKEIFVSDDRLMVTSLEMATHSTILAWRISRTQEPGGLLSTGLHRVGHD